MQITILDIVKRSWSVGKSTYFKRAVEIKNQLGVATYFSEIIKQQRFVKALKYV